jgi:hypothetical protein
MLARVLLCLLATTKVALCGWPFGSNFAYWLWQSCKEIVLYPRAEALLVQRLTTIQRSWWTIGFTLRAVNIISFRMELRLSFTVSRQI